MTESGSAHHVVASQQLSRQGAGALVLLEGDGAVDQRVAKPFGFLYQPSLTTREVVGVNGIVVEIAEVSLIVDDDIGPFSHPQHPPVAEIGEPGRIRAHLVVGLF